MLKIPDDVCKTVLNVQNKVCTTFGARENSSPDSKLTDQNL